MTELFLMFSEIKISGLIDMPVRYPLHRDSIQYGVLYCFYSVYDEEGDKC